MSNTTTRRDFHSRMIAAASPALALCRDYTPPATELPDPPLIVWEIVNEGRVLFRTLRETEAESWMRIRSERHPDETLEMRTTLFVEA